MFRFQTQTARDASGVGIRGGLRRSPLMGWSGRAPAPPAISWPGASRQGARHGCDSTECDCCKRHEPVPECVVRLVRKRSGGYRLIEIEDRVGSGNVGGPGWKARPIGIAVGREVHPVLRDDFFETAVGIGPGPVWRHKISKHIGKFGAVISSKILPKVLDARRSAHSPTSFSASIRLT